MRGKRRSDGTSEVVPDPDCRTGAKMIMQLHHVVNNLFHGIGLRDGRRRRTAIAAHVWRNAPPAFRREGLHLSAPHEPNFWPAVKEDHQWAAYGASLPVVRRMTGCTESV